MQIFDNTFKTTDFQLLIHIICYRTYVVVVLLAFCLQQRNAINQCQQM